MDMSARNQAFTGTTLGNKVGNICAYEHSLALGPPSMEINRSTSARSSECPSSWRRTVLYPTMARRSLDWRDGAAMRYGGSEPLHRFQYPTTHHSTSVNARKYHRIMSSWVMGQMLDAAYVKTELAGVIAHYSLAFCQLTSNMVTENRRPSGLTGCVNGHPCTETNTFGEKASHDSSSCTTCV